MTFGAILPDEEGNYGTPTLSLLFEVWDEYDYGEVEKDAVLDVLDRVEKLARSQIESMESAALDPAVDLFDPNRLKILDAFQAHLEGVDVMRGFFSTGDPDSVDTALEIIQLATNQMITTYQSMAPDEQAQEPPKLCVMCSAPNPREAKSCSQCHAILPVNETPTVSRLIAAEGPVGIAEDTAQTTPNFLEICDAYDCWCERKLDDETFLKTVVRILENQRAEQRSMTLALETPQGKQDEQYLVEWISILDLNIAALESIVQAVKRSDEYGVDDAVTALEDATDAIVGFEKRWPGR